MPAIVAAAGIDGVAFGMMAIVAATLIAAFVISPLRNGAQQVAGLVAVGGVLSWGLTVVADFAQSVINTFGPQVVTGRQQAVDWLNWLVYNIGWTYFGTYFNLANWSAAWVNNWIWTRALLFDTIIPTINASLAYQLTLINAAVGTINWLIGSYVPAVQAWINYFIGHVSALEAVSAQVVQVWLPWVNGWIDSLNGRTRVLERWATDTATQTLPRIEADVSRRALEAEAEALRARVGALERTVGLLASLAIIAALDVPAIRSLRDTALDPCRCLDLTNLNDLQERVSALEVQ